ncbi:MAG: hypothetical protein DRH26_00675 [Deltaproteobacteria bacterium]|nr:MAG: hypothetical protein DRH26_00675 [Deltaproteobacteria bacterium]
MAKEITITFKVSEQFADLLGRASFDIDRGKSEIIRTCILLSIDTIKAVPSLVNRLQIEDRINNNIEIIER